MGKVGFSGKERMIKASEEQIKISKGIVEAYEKQKNAAIELNRVNAAAAQAERDKELNNKKLEEQKKLAEERRKIEEEAANNSLAAYQAVRESEISLMEDGIAKEFAALDMKYEMEQIKYAGNKEMLAAIDLQYANQAELIITQSNQKELDAKTENINKTLEAQLLADEQFALSHFNTVNKMEADEIRLNETKKQLARDNVANQIAGTGQLFSAIAGANKRNAQERKNIARVEAAINTAVAITKALPNPIMVALATAIGIAQQVAINNAKFATGTAYQGGGLSLVGENGPEYVNLPRGASVYNNTQTRNMTTNASMNVTIMDSSGNVTETVRAQLRSGQGDQLVRDIQARMARMI
jgi:hypothetical protein